MEVLGLSNNYKLNNRKIFGEKSNFHHLGIVINKKINNTFEDLRYIYDPLQKVEVAFYKLNDLLIEVVSPSSNDSPIIKALENKSFYHHICFSVPNIKKALDYSSNYGVRRISKIVPAIAFENRNICWCIGKGYGLIELIER